MNKFVKGAKNLAFALSFVTVAACGGVKDADLKALEEKINNKLDGKADNGQGYALKNDIKDCVRKSEIGDFVKSEDVDNKIDGLKKETVGLDVLREAFSRNPVDYVKIFGYENLVENCLKGFEISMSGFNANGKCKFKVVNSGDKKVLIDEEQEARALTCGDWDVLKICIDKGAAIIWPNNNGYFEANGGSGVKFGGAMTVDFTVKDELVSLIGVLKLGLSAGKSFNDLKIGESWIISTSGIGGKKLAGGAVEEVKMLVDVLNQYVEGCCYLKDGDAGVVFVKGKGWTKNGSADLDDEVMVGFNA